MPASAAGDEVLFIEDFEHEWPGTSLNEWIRWDRDEGADIDYWCRTRYRSVSADHSAWCAVVGFNSMYRNAWNKNVTRLEGPDHQPSEYTLRYDLNMDGFMGRRILDADRYTSLAVSFQYWSEVGRAGTEVADDYMYVSVASTIDFPEQGEETVVWKQPVAATRGWEKVTVGLPAGSTWILFNFRSGNSVPAGGPYIGTFLDDIVVAGRTDDAPALGAAPLRVVPTVSGGEWAPNATVTLSAEGGSGTRTVQYRVDGGPWTPYSGPFVVEESGEHVVEAAASDSSGNVAPVATARFSIDRDAPTVRLEGNLTASAGWPWIGFHAVDNGSGVASVTATLDGAAVAVDLEAGTIEVSGVAGTHTLVVTATDRAGNTASAEGVITIEGGTAAAAPGPPVDLLLPAGLAVALVAIAVLVWRRR